jgi:hypothetical protein
MVGSIAILLRLLTISPSGWHASSGLDDLGHIVAQLGHGRGDVLRQDVAKGSKGVEFAAHKLVPSTHELNEFSGVNIWVTAVLDILDKFWGH